jgi:hypothetical protein
LFVPIGWLLTGGALLGELCSLLVSLVCLDLFPFQHPDSSKHKPATEQTSYLERGAICKVRNQGKDREVKSGVGGDGYAQEPTEDPGH